jgi:RIO kinase 1
LATARLSPPELAAAQAQVVDDLVVLARAGIVHADLSPYNLLWWQGRVWMIDLPQSVDLVGNPNGFDLLHRDVTTMATWFTRKGVPFDAEATFAALLAEAFT